MNKFISISFCLSLSFLFSQDNPWILTNHPKPIYERVFVLNSGVGHGNVDLIAENSDDDYDDYDEYISFRFAFLSPVASNKYSGFSISGYSQTIDYRPYGNYYLENHSITAYLIGYTYLASFNKNQFQGLFYGYDIGATYTIDGKYPLGITPAIFTSLFDRSKRSNIGLGVNGQIGYAFDNIMLSILFGFNKYPPHRGGLSKSFLEDTFCKSSASLTKSS